MIGEAQPELSFIVRMFLSLVVLGCAGLTGCHSAFVQATVLNHTGGTLRLFEVDYPSASFGGGDLTTGSAFHYRFKVLGDGPTKLVWTDAAEHEHVTNGPQLHEGEEGTLTIAVEPAGPVWHEDLHETTH